MHKGFRIAVFFRDVTAPIESAYPQDFEGREDITYFYSVCQSLKKLGYDVIHISLTPENISELKNVRFDLAFNLCDDGLLNKSSLEPHVPAICDIFDIKYTGSDYITLSTCLDKIRTKEILSYNNIRTPKFQMFTSGNEVVNRNLSFPLIVKPAREDASIGIRRDSVVNSEKDLRKKVKDVIRTYKQEALVEEYIDGREINVGIIGNKDPLILPISEISFDNIPSGVPKILTYDGKWCTESEDYLTTQSSCPTILDPKIEKEAKQMALKAYNLLSCRDYARIDMRISTDGIPYIIEANPNPDISPDAGLAKMSRVLGFDYTGMINLVVNSALERYNLIDGDKAVIRELISKKVKSKVSLKV